MFYVAFIVLSDKTEDELRHAIAKKYGIIKGNISNTIEAIISEWIKKQ